ncbi:hypothetical protein K7X08_012052 [Anisodus acutangulus]|uniref:Transmembrane protein n=1 Tax=Anisodus acutangulus TaxID=402998 RepID=A0A9Q1L9B8_9SOLA|nr:hypothetical protein K7X08_012052 [Anisodus acutangulus]
MPKIGLSSISIFGSSSSDEEPCFDEDGANFRIMACIASGFLAAASIDAIWDFCERNWVCSFVCSGAGDVCGGACKGMSFWVSNHSWTFCGARLFGILAGYFCAVTGFVNLWVSAPVFG